MCDRRLVFCTNWVRPSEFRTAFVQDIYEKGVATGDFQPGLNPLIIRWFLNAIGTFNVFNQHTFKAAFGNELDGPEGQELLRQQMVKGLLAIVQR